MINKKDLLKLASKEEVKRVMIKFKDRDQTKIQLLDGSIRVISKKEGGYEI